jgi:type I restriction enzyme S subunit
VGKAIKGALGSTLVKLKFPNIDTSYAYYFLQSKYIEINTRAKGVGIPHVDPNLLWSYNLPIPPRQEQAAIVSKIEELLSDLENGKQQLQLVQLQLKVYRQSLLKSAFEGIKDPKSISVEHCCSHIVDCLHSTAKFTSSGFFCVDTTCIENGKIMFNKIRYVNDQTYLERISRLKPEAGDVLFAREGTVGTTLIVPDKIELCLGQRMMMFRLKENITSKYFMYYFQSYFFKDKFQPIIMVTTAPHLNIRDVRKFNVVICPIEEQQLIVDELESKLTVCDKIEETISNSLQQAETLRQSILKKAFEGKLV